MLAVTVRKPQIGSLVGYRDAYRPLTDDFPEEYHGQVVSIDEDGDYEVRWDSDSEKTNLYTLTQLILID